MNLAHKLGRLRTMPFEEVRFRIREKIQIQKQRIRLSFPPPPPSNFRNYLAAAGNRFYPGVRVCPDFIQREFPQWIDRAIKEADDLCQHEIGLLNFGKVQLGMEIDWHRDPISGRAWERRFWADYDLEHDPIGRDAKIIHELNRHQHLPRLAKAFYLTHEERYAGEVIAQILSWIDQNPVGYGVNWHSSLEIAIRGTSWLWALFLVLPSKAFTDDAAERIGASLFAQMDHVSRHTSLYSSPNTHLLGEAAALFVAGTVFCDHREGRKWRDLGVQLLSDASGKQILEDGVYAELSTYYHCYALGFYLQVLALDRARFSEPVQKRVCSMLDFVMHITRPDGTVPRLGDDDGGRDVALVAHNYRSFRDGLCLGAILFARGDFKYCAEEFAEEAIWVFGEDAWDRFQHIENRAPVKSCLLFPNSGYSIQRSAWNAGASHVIFDCGGLGALTGGHSHADSLSVTVFANGKELLIDPGTYLYNGSPEWRKYFRSTRAHNTVEINGRDQADAGGSFRWNTPIHSRVKSISSADVEYIEASHDGYIRLRQRVIHRRRLLYVPGEYWILADDLSGVGECSADFWYHLGAAMSSEIERRPDGIMLRSDGTGLSLGIFTSNPLDARIVNRSRSEGYGHKTSSSSLCATVAGSLPIAAITIFSATNNLRISSVPVEGCECAVTCKLNHGEYQDIVVASGSNSEIAVAGFRLRGEFFWLRTRNNKLLSSFSRGDIVEHPICAALAAF